MTREQALRVAFPEPARIERRTAFLDSSQLAQARESAGPQVELSQRVVTYYVGISDSALSGAAYFDAHLVRTLPEVVMVVVAPGGRVKLIEVLKFAEPPEYRAPERWLEQFHGRLLTRELAHRRGIIGISGATLTSRALTQGVRRILALHEVIQPFEAADGVDQTVVPETTEAASDRQAEAGGEPP